jgi:hypothetical protein
VHKVKELMSNYFLLRANMTNPNPYCNPILPGEYQTNQLPIPSNHTIKADERLVHAQGQRKGSTNKTFRLFIEVYSLLICFGLLQLNFHKGHHKNSLDVEKGLSFAVQILIMGFNLVQSN